MDEVDIANLVYRCAEHIDNGDLISAAKLFSNAKVQLYKDGAYLTHDELLSLWTGEMIIYPDGTPRTKQLITNPIIEINRESGTATCRSYYVVTPTCMVTPTAGAVPLQSIASGRYHDEFVRIDGRWQFSLRVCSPFEATDDIALNEHNHATSTDATSSSQNQRNNASPTKTKILAAAQQIFSATGYSESSIRKIADAVGLSPTILFRHFGTKAALFEEALIASMGAPKPPKSREQFGQAVADMLADPTQPMSPHAMTVLATGNEEAREIAARVLQKHAINPMIEWLGPPDAESRALEIMALCAGFVLYNSRFNMAATKDKNPHMVEWLARSIQAIVDQTNPAADKT